MDIVQDFQRLRVLTPNCDYQKMDELVNDFTNALEESASHTVASAVKAQHTKQRKRLKKRAKPMHMSCAGGLISEDSEASIDDPNCMYVPYAEGVGKMSGDSDEISSASRISWCAGSQRSQHFLLPHPFPASLVVESDSVNENFSPMRSHRRKRKFKRMAVDPSPASSSSSVSVKHKRKQHSNIENVCKTLELMVCGKRKRSIRERSMDHMDMLCMPPPRQSSELYGKNKFGDDNMDFMESLRNEASGSSLSSSESDPGIYTNDEGREGDDEQSDYSHEPRPGSPGDSSKTTDEDSDSDSVAFQAMMSSSSTFQQMSPNSRQHLNLEMSKLAGMGRQVRSARRRLAHRLSLTPQNSLNEKISKFIKDPLQKELWLQANGSHEKDMINCLASLYSLSIHRENSQSCILIKSSREEAKGFKVFSSAGDVKRRRKTPPLPSTVAFFGDGFESTSTAGMTKLRNLDWDEKHGRETVTSLSRQHEGPSTTTQSN